MYLIYYQTTVINDVLSSYLNELTARTDLRYPLSLFHRCGIQKRKAASLLLGSDPENTE